MTRNGHATGDGPKKAEKKRPVSSAGNNGAHNLFHVIVAWMAGSVNNFIPGIPAVVGGGGEG